MSMPTQSSSWTTLVSAEALSAALGQDNLVVLDARFALADPAQGERDYTAEHIPGARYANLDRDLSDLDRAGHGRHPLPDAAALCATLSRWGIDADTQVVAYDARDGALVAARVWCLLRLLGHARVAVLDGGLARWRELGLPLTAAPTPAAKPTRYRADYDNTRLIDAEALRGLRSDGALRLIDARAGERFRGEVEPLDKAAGHVPGAVNRPFPDNLRDDGRFRSPDELAKGFRELMGDRPIENVAVMCGSGVTACHHLLAMQHAGLPGARLYADSWSGWISDPSRPIATGAA
jgi:thiosulfate/3-mercaptopyruvate sulfurtransferase